MPAAVHDAEPVPPKSTLALRYFPISFSTFQNYSCLIIKILFIFLVSAIRSTCANHLSLHYITTLTVRGDMYKLRSSSLRHILKSPRISRLICPNSLLGTLFSSTWNYALPSKQESKFLNHKRRHYRANHIRKLFFS
jgi:hypothetical protein